MRIDAIDLFGPLYVNGVVGSEGQILGFSGSQVTWITASGSGSGTVGPQGPTGASYPVQSCRIVFGDISNIGLTASQNFCYVLGSNILVHHNGAPTITNSTNGSMLAVMGGTLSDSSHISILASKDSKICKGQYSSIIGGEGNDLGLNSTTSISKSIIMGGYLNTQEGNNIYSSIIGGEMNSIRCGSGHGCSSINSTILGGKCNSICASISGFSTNLITGGYKNSILTGNSSILGGKCNLISYGTIPTLNSSILGGESLYICTINSSGYLCNASIIGGKSSSGLLGDKCVILGNCFSVIIGGTDTKGGNYFLTDFYHFSLFADCIRVDEMIKLKCHVPAYDLNDMLSAASGTLINSPKSGGGSNYFYFNLPASANKLCFCPN